MNPQEQYTALIHNRAINPLPKSEYGENHHIYPRCLGGNDEPENIIRLTPEEHYKAHYLLPLIYTEGKEHAKLLYAWNQMRGRIGNIDKDSEEYGILKREYAKQRSIDQKGKRCSDETKRKLSEANTGKKRTEEQKVNIKRAAIERGKKMLGTHHSEETRRRMSASQKGRTSPWKGKHLSEETRQKMSLAHKGKPSPFKGKTGKRQKCKAQNS